MGKDVLSPAQAWRVYDEWRTDDRVVFLSEVRTSVSNGGYWDSKSREVPTPGLKLIWPFLQVTTSHRWSHWTVRSGHSERLISSFLFRQKEDRAASRGVSSVFNGPQLHGFGSPPSAHSWEGSAAKLSYPLRISSSMGDKYPVAVSLLIGGWPRSAAGAGPGRSRP
jgi:hypothetical protein